MANLKTIYMSSINFCYEILCKIFSKIFLNIFGHNLSLQLLVLKVLQMKSLLQATNFSCNFSFLVSFLYDFSMTNNVH